MEQRQFRRSDGVLGCGFLIHHRGGRKCFSISWPDRDHEYQTPEACAELGIEDLSQAKIDAKAKAAGDEEARQAEKLRQEQAKADAEIAEAQAQRMAEEKARLESQPIPVEVEGSYLAHDPDAEHEMILEHLREVGTSVTNKSVVQALAAKGVKVDSSQVTAAKQSLE